MTNNFTNFVKWGFQGRTTFIRGFIYFNVIFVQIGDITTNDETYIKLFEKCFLNKLKSLFSYFLELKSYKEKHAATLKNYGTGNNTSQFMISMYHNQIVISSY